MYSCIHLCMVDTGQVLPVYLVPQDLYGGPRSVLHLLRRKMQAANGEDPFDFGGRYLIWTEFRGKAVRVRSAMDCYQVVEYSLKFGELLRLYFKGICRAARVGGLSSVPLMCRDYDRVRFQQRPFLQPRGYFTEARFLADALHRVKCNFDRVVQSLGSVEGRRPSGELKIKILHEGLVPRTIPEDQTIANPGSQSYAPVQNLEDLQRFELESVVEGPKELEGSRFFDFDEELMTSLSEADGSETFEVLDVPEEWEEIERGQMDHVARAEIS